MQNHQQWWQTWGPKPPRTEDATPSVTWPRRRGLLETKELKTSASEASHCFGHGRSSATYSHLLHGAIYCCAMPTGLQPKEKFRSAPCSGLGINATKRSSLCVTANRCTQRLRSDLTYSTSRHEPHAYIGCISSVEAVLAMSCSTPKHGREHCQPIRRHHEQNMMVIIRRPKDPLPLPEISEPSLAHPSFAYIAFCTVTCHFWLWTNQLLSISILLNQRGAADNVQYIEPCGGLGFLLSKPFCPISIICSPLSLAYQFSPLSLCRPFCHIPARGPLINLRAVCLEAAQTILSLSAFYQDTWSSTTLFCPFVRSYGSSRDSRTWRLHRKYTPTSDASERGVKPGDRTVATFQHNIRYDTILGPHEP